MRVNVLFRVTAVRRVTMRSHGSGLKPDEGDEWIRVGGIKLGVDGGFEGGWMRDPYDEPMGGTGTSAVCKLIRLRYKARRVGR